MASQAHWMLQMLDALGVSQAAVVAHDVGSAAAQIMLATAPQRVGRDALRLIDMERCNYLVRRKTVAGLHHRS
jgi:pimeloyl-ACP methyl ester carboxylesterase